MKTIYTTCKPRQDILAGMFNPEIFTASLSQVVDHYRGKAVATHPIYTDAQQFFTHATYPTEGLKSVALEVMSRLSGDTSAPAIHRLETAFGGGKTHTLIALTHLAQRGVEISDAVSAIVPASVLPKAGEVIVVGIAGDELPVIKTQGTKMTPYTLWGEIAYQVGGEGLYIELGEEANSFSAPSKSFLERIFTGRKVLLMLDELAQYATRLEGAHAGGGEQLASFLMTLLGYARTSPGLSVVLTLSGSKDAFATQAKRLRDLLGKVLGHDVDEATAAGIAARATKGVASVIARDATTVVPVQATEISRVLARRLFETINESDAQETVQAYVQMYSKNAAMLPDKANRDDFTRRMENNYPFHPNLVDYLNQKLATVETFQGTRGVLRVLSLVVRNLWSKPGPELMIHTGNVDLTDARIVNELLGRTGSSPLLPVLNTDVGGPDTSALEAGESRSELCDRRNPHPAGFPMHVLAWRTVFLHSLAGHTEGLASNVFGIVEREALLETAFPGLTPPMVETALAAIKTEAYYLRERDGRYYASLDPSVNRALGDIRNSVHDDKAWEHIAATARKIVKTEAGSFHVNHDVSAPEHIPDQEGAPHLAMIDPRVSEIDVEAFVQTAGGGKARQRQNLVFLLLPETVKVKGETWSTDQVMRVKEQESRVLDMARDVLARRKLKERPDAFGLKPQHLDEENFEGLLRERDLAVQTEVQRLYDVVWYPSASGQITKREIRTAGGESGVALIQKIREALKTDGELITGDNATSKEVLYGSAKLFFADGDVVSLTKLRGNFACLRHWPVLEKPELLEMIVRIGVEHHAWCLFRMADSDSDRPTDIHHRDKGQVPLNINLADSGWSLITIQGATKRGWIGSTLDPKKVQQWVYDVVREHGAATSKGVAEQVVAQFGEVPEGAVYEALGKVVQEGKLMAFTGDPEQAQKPVDLVSGGQAVMLSIQPGKALITRAKAAEKGWVGGATQDKGIKLTEAEVKAKVLPNLRTLGSLYQRGAKSAIDTLDLWDLEVVGGGRMRIALTDLTPDSMKRLQEFFETLALVAKPGADTGGELEIRNPEDECLLVQTLTGNKA